MDKVISLKAKYNFRDVAYSLVGEITSKGRDFTQHACLYCESSDAFTVYKDSCFCFSCEKHGDVIDLLAYKNNQTVGDFLRGNDCEISAEEVRKLREENEDRERKRSEIAARKHENALKRLYETKAWILYHKNLDTVPAARQLWENRGVPHEWQNIWHLGYNPSAKYGTKSGVMTTASMTIPFYNRRGEVKYVQNRLLGTIDGSRYRPEIKGLEAIPFFCDIELGDEESRMTIIIEGAIKSMVTHITYNDASVQTVGAYNKAALITLVRKMKNQNVLVVPDPDSIANVKLVAKESGARVLVLPEKLDDMIVDYNLDTSWLRYAIKQARIV
ncbi:MAG: hypothetical protein GY755_24365 [Chloroflexi bacterium]|nr:hypothetical protein [Chloroflexota bacterium]